MSIRSSLMVILAMHSMSNSIHASETAMATAFQKRLAEKREELHTLQGVEERMQRCSNSHFVPAIMVAGSAGCIGQYGQFSQQLSLGTMSGDSYSFLFGSMVGVVSFYVTLRICCAIDRYRYPQLEQQITQLKEEITAIEQGKTQILIRITV